MSEANGKTFDLKEWIKHHVTDLAAYGGLIVCLIIFSVLPPMFGENLWSAETVERCVNGQRDRNSSHVCGRGFRIFHGTYGH